MGKSHELLRAALRKSRKDSSLRQVYFRGSDLPLEHQPSCQTQHVVRRPCFCDKRSTTATCINEMLLTQSNEKVRSETLYSSS